jgi:CubicO group peptidase (beta-lactamase class C family)
MDTTDFPQGIMAGFPPEPSAQVTLANWRLPPLNNWSFSNVRQILPTARIRASNSAERLALRAEKNIGTLTFAGPDGKKISLEKFLDATQTDGFLVQQGGRIVTENYSEFLKPDMPHIVFSVSKSITGTLAGILVGRGQLDPKSPVTRYIPEAAGSAYGDCTVQHVLDMTVSIDFVEDYKDTKGPFARYRIATGWNPELPGIENIGLRKFLVTLPRGKAPHGKSFHYVSPNSDLLGWILERASGLPYPRMLSELLWQKMGAEFDADITLDRLGAPRTAGGICVTLRDLARVGETMRLGGLSGGREIVPAAWVKDCLQNGDPAAWKGSEMAGFVPKGRYRNQWYATGEARGAFFAVGIHGQWIYVDPPSETVIVKLSAQPDAVDSKIEHLSLLAFDAVARALDGDGWRSF